MITSSLIITTYNRPDALELVLLSILKQKKLPNEVIIADDGSTDSTRNLITHYQTIFPIPLIHSWQADEGFRAASSRNLAIKKTQFEYIIMIDGDMILEPHFILDHVNSAKKGFFIQGRRVLLDKVLTELALKENKIKFHFLESHLSNRLNAIRCPLFSKIVTPALSKKDTSSVRSCNFSLWKKDILKVNGFNEDFIGWGREDSELVVRLMNLGITRLDLRFGGIGYHLFHPDNTRQMLLQNDQLLQNAITQKWVRCQNGIDKLPQE